ncbi:MAG TPA: dihydroxyacetone kinase [Firmicutes bacterium]|nr:dihydroxyacetone kinase [Bacillota bacterium]
MDDGGQKPVLLSGHDLRQMFLQGTAYFEQHKEIINDLNVFPVPDGDTGTNMALTLQAASRELLSISSACTIGEIARVAARSALMGARGNSGVILSQLFQGIARGMSGKEKARLPELGRAFQYGIVYAYKAVSKPVEGTILTVAREMARGSRNAIQEDINLIELLNVAIKSGKNALERTPDLLPVLKEAGVVDAGGLGLIVFLEGCRQSIAKHAMQPVSAALEQKKTTGSSLPIPSITEVPTERVNLKEEFDARYPYCTELIIKGDALSVRLLRDHLEELGDSLLVAGSADAIKIHIHTANPGSVLQRSLTYGSIHDIKIDNMLDQFTKTRWHDSSQESGRITRTAVEQAATDRIFLSGEIGIVAVVAGAGFASIFTSMGADRIIPGGQSMNPSVKDIVDAVIDVPAESVIVLPNNSNVQFAAEQAVKLVEKEVSVVDSHSLPQGLSALLAFEREKSFAENFVEMCLRTRQVKTLEITFATRDAVVNGISVKKGDIIGITDGTLLVSGLTVDETVLELLRIVLGEEEQIITLFYGHDVGESEAVALMEQVVADHPQPEVELQFGGQPLYYYIISVE